MKIKNFSELSLNRQREIALEIAESGLQAIDTYQAVKKFIKFEDQKIILKEKSFELAKNGKLVVISIGKCALDATIALEEILGESITTGIVLDIKEEPNHKFKKIEYLLGTHPMPSDLNVESSRKITQKLSGLTADDLVVFLISGGGSTLLCLPEEGYKCADEKIILSELFIAGAPIEEINTVRKHMSLARGGFLAKYAFPAKVISLIFSDVPGNDIRYIASGPTVKDDSTINDADRILDKYHILKTCSMEHCGLVETPKDDIYFEKVYNTILVSNEIALEAMKEKSESFGLSVNIVDTKIAGLVEEVCQKILYDLSSASPSEILLYGGETTVKIKGKGRGGRNQELALRTLVSLKENQLVLTLASDGKDNGPYAGAIADSITKEKAEAKKIEVQRYLEENNSSEFFEETRDFLDTGSTGSNVSDIYMAINFNN